MRSPYSYEHVGEEEEGNGDRRRNGPSSSSSSSSFGVRAALAVSVAAVMIAAVPVALLVVYSAPVLESLSQSHVSINAAATEVFRAQRQQLPSKWAAPYNVPQYFQEDRGTCWDFAAIGVLEQSYRHNGVIKGFLKPSEYVRFSDQAFGISTINECRGHPDVCDVLGDYVMQNSTTGGEVWWLYSLTKLYTQLLPDAVCPYTDEANELKCPGMTEALAKNPVRFNIKNMETAYNVLDTKSMMVAHNRPLAWSSLMHEVVFYMPCAEQYWSQQPGCSAAKRVRCPSDRFYNSEYCARFESAMYNQDGEFFAHGNMIPEGGHAMNVVGYNDEFVTKQGHRGGFIIKNSWHDLTYNQGPSGRGARGSHSVAYWMQQISGWDEKALCPNPLNPDNWQSCVNQQMGPTMRRSARARRSDSDDVDVSVCLNATYMKYLVDVALQPAEFRCRALPSQDGWCSNATNYRYWLLSSERSVEQDLVKLCMLQYDTTNGAKKTICTPYVNPSLITYIWAPIAEQEKKLQNDPDYCGYYFWPYELSYKQTGMYVNYFSTYFDIEWDDSSYAANANKYGSQFDYGLLRQSTHQQKLRDFGSLPSPWAKQRY